MKAMMPTAHDWANVNRRELNHAGKEPSPRGGNPGPKRDWGDLQERCRAAGVGPSSVRRRIRQAELMGKKISVDEAIRQTQEYKKHGKFRSKSANGE